jgi:hypothetical protein
MTRDELIRKIEALPGQVRAAVAGAGGGQLDRPYRPGGWSARQVVHHLADSHMNAYIRCRLILTEAEPPLKGYAQDDWARLPDASGGPLEPSLAILDGLHARWAAFFRALPEDAWQRAGRHTEYGPVTLGRILETYAAHGEKHLEHIRLGLSGN